MSIKSRQLRVWWIDDEPDRLKKFPRDAIERPPQLPKRHAKLEIIELKKSNGIVSVLQQFEDAKGKKQGPDLIVIDQMLQLWGDLQRGSSLAAIIRDKYPDVALVGVTGMTVVEASAVERLQKSQFIEFYLRDAIASGDCIPDLYAIADGYAALTKFFNAHGATGRIVNQLCILVKCPKVDAELFVACLPGIYKMPWDTGTSHTFARWVWHQLLERPGLLYDDLETATLLGLKPGGLSLIEKHLEKCKYEGIFASTTRRRWWVSYVRDEIRKLMKADMSQPLWSLGRDLAGGEKYKEFFSKCYARPNSPDAPTVVAFSDGTQRNRVQAAISDTVPIETDSPALGFDQRRMFVRS